MCFFRNLLIELGIDPRALRVICSTKCTTCFVSFVSFCLRCGKIVLSSDTCRTRGTRLDEPVLCHRGLDEQRVFLFIVPVDHTASSSAFSWVSSRPTTTKLFSSSRSRGVGLNPVHAAIAADLLRKQLNDRIVVSARRSSASSFCRSNALILYVHELRQ